MKRDYYSDIKLAQRLIFENSAYLLTMLDKKVDSFTSHRTPNMRMRDRSDLLHPNNILHPEAPRSAQNPLINLANDLTKPIWNCITRMEPVALCCQPWICANEVEKIVSYYNHLMIRFLERFKREHEDQGSLKLHLNLINRKDSIDLTLLTLGKEERNKTEQRLQELFSLLLSIYTKKQSQMNKEENIIYQKYEAQSLSEMLKELTQKDEVSGEYRNMQLVGEVVNFGQMMGKCIENVAESSSGPMFINYWLDANNLGLMLHPMMLGIYCCIKGQVAIQEESREISNVSNQIQNEQEQQFDQPMFQQFKSDKCSKITFINLDGFESPLNLLLAKHLGKYLQYISFPEQERYLAQDQDLSSYFKWRSQMLCRQFMAGELEERQRNWLERLFNVREGRERQVLQLYKRLLIVPVGSLYLNSKMSKGGFAHVQNFQSHFIAFAMRELLLNQIREFNPSVIIISHANTLPIIQQHFQEIISQLSVLTNMKLIFYNNLTHTVIPYTIAKPDNKINNFLKSYFREYHRLKWSLYDARQCPLNLDLLRRVQIFLKVCSGTMNFISQQRDQRYENFKIMSYAGQILKLISYKHPSLQRYQNRFGEYIKMEKMFSNYFTQKTFSQYHTNLLSEVEKNVYSLHRSSGTITQLWKGFVLQYSLKLQKEQKEQFTKYLARFRSKDKNNTNICNQIIALQFQIGSQQEEQSISISQNSQILMNSSRRYFPCPIFVLNHLSESNQPILQNYVGVVDQQIEKNSEQRVSLKEIKFVQKQYNINQFQHFTQFNYHETQNAVILFWPLLYDAVHAVEHQFQRKQYQAPITNLIFVGLKMDITNLINIDPCNDSYRNLHPRIGCTCYEPLENGNIYIFGGFYTDLSNHLDFQTDVSVMRIQQDYRVIIQNIPKSFYMNFNLGMTSKQSYQITGILNDFVRPRVEYQVFQLEKMDMNKHEILLLGGVGQKFTRPFSLIGYMAHLITFEGQLIRSIKRIKLNNVVPANIVGPIISRSPLDISVVKSAQNRRIITSHSIVPAGTPTYSAFRLKYILQDQRIPVQNRTHQYKRMTYNKIYQFGLSTDCDQIEGNVFLLMREGSDQRSVKASLRHISYHQQNEASILLSVDGSNPHHLNFYLQLQQDQSQKFVNLVGNKVILASHHILSVDIHLLQVYALICHQQYTEGKTVLVRSTSKKLQQVIDSEAQNLCLSEIYCFDRPFRNHVLVALEGQQVAVLHGCHFNQNIHVECVVKWKGGYFVRQPVKSSEAANLAQSSKEWTELDRPNRKSFFVWVRERLACVSIVSVGRSDMATEQVLLILQELVIGEKSVKWVLRNHNVVTLEIVDMGREMSPEETLPPPKEVIDLRVHFQQEAKCYTMTVACKGLIYQGTIELQALAKTKIVQFELVQGCAQVNYQYHRLRHSSNSVFAKYLNKREKVSEMVKQRT